jgi:hypothetical protein
MNARVRSRPGRAGDVRLYGSLVRARDSDVDSEGPSLQAVEEGKMAWQSGD